MSAAEKSTALGSVRVGKKEAHMELHDCPSLNLHDGNAVEPAQGRTTPQDGSTSGSNRQKKNRSTITSEENNLCNWKFLFVHLQKQASVKVSTDVCLAKAHII